MMVYMFITKPVLLLVLFVMVDIAAVFTTAVVGFGSYCYGC